MPRTIAVLGSSVAADVERSSRNLKSVWHKGDDWKHTIIMHRILQQCTTIFSPMGMASGTVSLSQATPNMRSTPRTFHDEVLQCRHCGDSPQTQTLQNAEKPPESRPNTETPRRLVELLSSLRCGVRIEIRYVKTLPAPFFFDAFSLHCSGLGMAATFESHHSESKWHSKARRVLAPTSLPGLATGTSCLI